MLLFRGCHLASILVDLHRKHAFFYYTTSSQRLLLLIKKILENLSCEKIYIKISADSRQSSMHLQFSTCTVPGTLVLFSFALVQLKRP